MSGTRKFSVRRGIALDTSGPAQPSEGRAKRVFALVLLVATVAVGLAEFSGGHGVIPIAWLSVGPLLASLVLSPWITAALAGWALLLGLGLMAGQPGLPGSPGMLGLASARADADAKVRDGKRAVESATKACELSEWQDAFHLGTLAAAYAETGDFDTAVKWQTKANALYTEADDTRKGEARLKLYQAKKRYRTDP